MAHLIGKSNIKGQTFTLINEGLSVHPGCAIIK